MATDFLLEVAGANGFFFVMHVDYRHAFELNFVFISAVPLENSPMLLFSLRTVPKRCKPLF